MSSLDIMKLILKNIGRKRLLIPIPFWYLSLAGWFLQKLPNPLLTLDQVRQLKVDNVVSDKAQGLKNLGIDPTPVEAILPNYLKRYRKSGYKFQSSNGT